MSTTSKRSNTRSRKGPPELTQMQAAALLGVSVRQFQAYQIEPAARRGRYAYYALPALVAYAEERARRKGYEAGLRDGKVPENAAELQAAQQAAELRLTEERAEYQRLKNAEQRRELAPVEMLTWALSDLASQIVPILNSIPGDIKRRNPRTTNAELHLMREAIAGALNLVAEVRLDFDAYDDQDEPPIA